MPLPQALKWCVFEARQAAFGDAGERQAARLNAVARHSKRRPGPSKQKPRQLLSARKDILITFLSRQAANP
jgi:hypothetical protein